jgi:hypothetical protein
VVVSSVRMVFLVWLFLVRLFLWNISILSILFCRALSYILTRVETRGLPHMRRITSAKVLAGVTYMGLVCVL